MGGGPTNPTDPDWPNPHFPTAATPAAQLPWPLNELFSGQTLSAEELRDLRRFLDPYTLTRLRTRADDALEDEDQARKWADYERDVARRWRELAEDAEREAERWRKKAEETNDPESRKQYERFAESWEKDAEDRRKRAAGYDGNAEEYDERADGYRERHDQAVKDAEQAVKDAEAKVEAEKEAERLAREKAERERLRKEREALRERIKKLEAQWARERAEKAEREAKAAEERRLKQAQEAWEKEFDRLNGIAGRHHEQFKAAERRLRRDPDNPRYRRDYGTFKARYEQAESKVAAHMEGGPQERGSSSPPPAGRRDTGPSASDVMRHDTQDRALDVTGKVTGQLLTEGSASATRTAAGAALGQAIDVKTVIDLGKAAQEVVEKAPEQIRLEIEAIEDPDADPMEFQRHRLRHTGQRVRALLDSSSPF